MSKKNLATWTTMLTWYAKSGDMAKSRWLFDAMPQRDVVAWNALISANAQNGELDEALTLFNHVPDPNVVTWTTMIQAFANRSKLPEAQSLFDVMHGRNAVTWTTLMLAYAENGFLHKCVGFFQRMPSWDLIACTAMVEFYSHNNMVDQACSVFHHMQSRNAVTWISLLAGYCQGGDLERAYKVFTLLPCTCVVSITVMLTGYGQNGQLESAKSLFQKLPERDIGAWNAMLAVAADNGESSLALSLFKLADLEGLHANKLTYLSTLEACAQIPSLLHGKLVHETISEELLLDMDVKTALLTLYSRCGALKQALEIFNRIPSKDVVCWSSMVTAYAQNGLALEALAASRLMILEGLEPQLLTFISVLAACSHGGLCKEGIGWFTSMSVDFGVTPRIDHYRCMVDLFGRAGHVSEAADVVLNMPFEPDAATWRSYLAAGKVQKGEGNQIPQEFAPDDAATYVLLSQQ